MGDRGVVGLFPAEAAKWWEIGEVAGALLVDEGRLRDLIKTLDIPIRTVTINLRGARPARGELIHIKAVRQLAALCRQELLGY